jgi:hypothetical protein
MPARPLPRSDSMGPLFCARCSTKLYPGRGDHFRITVEAVADPAPPVFEEADLEKDLPAEIERTLARLEVVSEREAMDQVYRRLTFYLCGVCYRDWIENPTG